MGAMAAVVLGLCSTGDHIVTQNRLYAGTQMLFSAVCPRFGIEVTSVDGADPDAGGGDPARKDDVVRGGDAGKSTLGAG